jgi:indolepyruvate ferredoxin oxidoreductase
LIGAAFQKDLIPLSMDNLLTAIAETVSKQDLEKNIAAFQLGRRIVLDPQDFSREIQGDNLSYQDLLREKSELLKKRIFTGKSLSRRYRGMVEEAIRWIHLDERSSKKIALRVYELIQYENLGLAERYLSLLWDVYRKDRADMDFAATRSVIENLFKVMAIKDEIYVAHLLTSREKLERDRRRYGIDESNGDKIEYVHLNRPQFDFFGLSVEFDLKTRNWMLDLMKYCKFLRRVLVGWHRREKSFRNWYVGLVRKFNYHENESVYRAYVEILKSPDQVRGYRKIRYPKMEEVRANVNRILAEIQAMEKPRSGSLANTTIL